MFSKISAKGDVVKVKEGSVEALEGHMNINDLTPKSVHGFVTNAYAELFGLEIESSVGEDEATISIKIP